MKRDQVYLAGPSVSAAGSQNLFEAHTERVVKSVKGRGMFAHCSREQHFVVLLFSLFKNVPHHGAWQTQASLGDIRWRI